MDRRTFLRWSGALSVGSLAGCIVDNPTAVGNEPTDDSVSITDSTVERTESGCSSGADPTASVSIDDDSNVVSFSGHLVAGTPCHNVSIARATYNRDDDWLTVDLGTERAANACIDCIGRIDFDGTVDFAGGVPSRVTISHDDSVLTDTEDDDESTPADEPRLQASSFSVTGVESSSPSRTADASFDTDAETVTVTGTIVGTDGCTTADLGTAEYDADDSQLTVDVVTRKRDDASERLCTEQMVGIDYEATFAFDGGTPSSVSVSHDGDGIMAAGHGSTSVSAPDSDT
ncbi:hypothetical protein [Salinibaculum rarum]|uniref:hypothetical protein n=1 Tax=Salinibaculum rarum TaxID=3058903 RepID=UPI00265E81BF|nr:hypothetical protein [Salinibaculum sp. KK48]